MDMDLALSIAGAAREAGAGIMDIYESGHLGVEVKSDHSPLTKADIFSHELITGRLEELTPDIPVISEEGKQVDYALRSQWRRFYLVDPLDGTRSFIGRSGEFTVNIALVEDGKPVLGVIYAPASDTLYYSLQGEGSYRRRADEEQERIEVAAPREPRGLVAVISRSHRTNEQEALVDSGMVSDFIPSGSSLKFCLVAEGRAHIYPRFGPLWEWDTAAGHAILREAGGRVVDPGTRRELEYNKRDLLHGGLLALPGWLLEDMVPYMDRIIS
jgi:3'(2'), 5'-bisphosphate nucleotidase